jgi:hypothetical protein
MLSKRPQDSSLYIRTSWMLSAGTTLQFIDSSKIRFFSVEEAENLAQQIQKRNVFARHSGENSFYVQRVKGLANHTIIEVFRPGDPKSMGDLAEKIALTIEKIVVLSSTIVLNKVDLQRKLGISSKPKTITNFILSSDFRFISSRARPEPIAQGLYVDEKFTKRFAPCGFEKLVAYVWVKNNLAERVRLSLDWLFDSRIESRLPASVVKTSIALESLLVFSESESLAQSLSERAAFILSSNTIRRQQISRILKRFYDARSGVVHGSQKKAKKLTPNLLETVDRLAILLCLVIAANSDLWPTTEAIRDWCENQRWGVPSSEVKIPFPDLYLKNTLASGQKEIELKS